MQTDWNLNLIGPWSMFKTCWRSENLTRVNGLPSTGKPRVYVDVPLFLISLSFSLSLIRRPFTGKPRTCVCVCVSLFLFSLCSVCQSVCLPPLPPPYSLPLSLSLSLSLLLSCYCRYSKYSCYFRVLISPFDINRCNWFTCTLEVH